MKLTQLDRRPLAIMDRIADSSHKQKNLESRKPKYEPSTFSFDKLPRFITAMRSLSAEARLLFGILLGHYMRDPAIRGKSHSETENLHWHRQAVEIQVSSLCSEKEVDPNRVIGWCYPNVYTLARKLGYDGYREKVSKVAGELIRPGVLLRARRGNISNLYVLLLPEIQSAEQLMGEFWLSGWQLGVGDFSVPDDCVRKEIELLLECVRGVREEVNALRRDQRRKNAYIRSQRRRDREGVQFLKAGFEMLDFVQEEAWKEFIERRKRKGSSCA